MNSTCTECHRILNGSRRHVNILGCPFDSRKKGCITGKHDAKEPYVPPEYRHMPLLSVSSSRGVDDHEAVMYAYGDPERAGHRIYGICLS